MTKAFSNDHFFLIVRYMHTANTAAKAKKKGTSGFLPLRPGMNGMIENI